jgi:hypothetical protein
MVRSLVRSLALFLVMLPLPALAQVQLTFHSFNGSVLIGRYPHTFISLAGTLEETGAPINENYGYTAVTSSPIILTKNVDGEIHVEKAKYLTSTNRHFTVPLSDAQYWAVRAEVDKWRNAPGADYSLATNNCIHFVSRIANLVGLTADVPKSMTRTPKKWLNYVTRLNPQLGAKEIK